jgi:hypothetical protein
MNQVHALILTLAVEVPVALLLLARWAPAGHAVLAVAGVSLLTHPIAWWASTVGLRSWSFPARAAAIEVAVVAVEAVILAWTLRLAAPRALAVAAAMNAASFAVGIIVALTLA